MIKHHLENNQVCNPFMQWNLGMENSCVTTGKHVIDDVGTCDEISLSRDTIVVVKLGIRIHKLRDLAEDEHITIECPTELATIGVAFPWSCSRRVPGVEFVEHQAFSGIGFARRLIDSWLAVPTAILTKKIVVVNESHRIPSSFDCRSLE
jgi:hypothetical protein